jgi:hypothetical protein
MLSGLTDIPTQGGEMGLLEILLVVFAVLIAVAVIRVALRK